MAGVKDVANVVDVTDVTDVANAVLEYDENMKKRIIYRSVHRGCKENDIIMEAFCEKHLDLLNGEELKVYEEFLDEPDEYIYFWVCKAKQPNGELAGSGANNKYPDAPDKYGKIISLMAD